MIPALPAAVAEYLIVSAPWHLSDVAPKANTGEATFGLTVTECMAITGPLQPEAVAVTTNDPNQVGAKVISPVAALMLFPPEVPDAFKLYTMAVELVAVAV